MTWIAHVPCNDCGKDVEVPMPDFIKNTPKHAYCKDCSNKRKADRTPQEGAEEI